MGLLKVVAAVLRCPSLVKEKDNQVFDTYFLHSVMLVCAWASFCGALLYWFWWRC